MKTEEAIEEVISTFTDQAVLYGNPIGEDIDRKSELGQIITLLQQGEQATIENVELGKYKKMWNEFKEEYGSCNLLNKNHEYPSQSLYEGLYACMENEEDKYFPNGLPQ